MNTRQKSTHKDRQTEHTERATMERQNGKTATEQTTARYREPQTESHSTRRNKGRHNITQMMEDKQKEYKQTEQMKDKHNDSKKQEKERQKNRKKERKKERKKDRLNERKKDRKREIQTDTKNDGKREQKKKQHNERKK